MSDRANTDTERSFSAAMEELERILEGIEDERIDIDVLGRELARAAELLELCRAKIRRAETEVSQIVRGLEEGRAEERTGEREPEEESRDSEPAAETPNAGPEAEIDDEEELPF